MYHGAEHKAIAAYERDVELTPESAQQFSTAHVRCGTNFLLTVMVVTILLYSVFGRPGWVVLIASRVVLIPVVAGLSYEVIRFAARNMHRRWVATGMKPGLALQRMTTREPSLDQLEVAIASLKGGAVGLRAGRGRGPGEGDAPAESGPRAGLRNRLTVRSGTANFGRWPPIGSVRPSSPS